MRINLKITDQELAQMEELKKRNYDENRYNPDPANPANTSKLVLLFTIIKFDIRRNLRVWLQNILSPLFSALLYFILFGVILGAKIGDVGGFKYVAFLIPGYMVMPMVNNSFANGAYSSFMMIYFKTIEDFQRSPLNTHIYLFAYMCSTVCRVIVTVALIYLAAFIVTKQYIIIHPFLLLLVIILVSSIFALAGMLNGLYARNFEEINFVPMFIMTPLLYLSGIFLPINELPPIAEYISYFNPLVYIVTLTRFTFLGFHDIPILVCLGFLLVFFVFLYYLTYRRAVKCLNFH